MKQEEKSEERFFLKVTKDISSGIDCFGQVFRPKKEFSNVYDRRVFYKENKLIENDSIELWSSLTRVGSEERVKNFSNVS